MSTRASIKWRERKDETPGFHLYDDLVDGLDGTPYEATPVYLRLDGVEIDDLTTIGGACVTIALPREMARALGLVK